MTATVYSSSLLYSGLRELSQVTNSFAGYFISDGSAYTLTLPWNPDKIEWFNYTKYATNDKNLQGVWFRDFPAGDALIVSRGTTTLSSTLEATNGVTQANVASAFAAEQKTITGVSTATPAVVTVASTAAYADYDRVVITKLAGAVGSILNNNTYVIRVLDGTTFALYDTFGNPVANAGTYTSGGQSTLTGPSLGVVNAQPVYAVTLGTAVVGDSTDVIYVAAYKFNAYFNFGSA